MKANKSLDASQCLQETQQLDLESLDTVTFRYFPDLYYIFMLTRLCALILSHTQSHREQHVVTCVRALCVSAHRCCC